MEFSSIEELKNEASKYEHVKTSDLVQIFKDNHIYFPDFVYRFLLLNTFKKHIFDESYLQLYSDEFKYKLRSYNFFSIHLLRKTIEEYNIDVKPSEFKNMLMRFFLKNEKKFKKTIVIESFLSSVTIDENSTESISECLSNFDEIFYTPKGYLDGLSLTILKESVVATYSMPYLKDLGLKYNVNIPKRINRAQLLDLVSARLMLSDEERAELESKSITDISTYSKKKGFKVSSDLKKSDMVEYIIFSLNKYNEEVEKDLYNYDILTETDNVEPSIDQDELETTDQAIPTSDELVDPSEAPNEEENIPSVSEAEEKEPSQENNDDVPADEPVKEDETIVSAEEPEADKEPSDEEPVSEVQNAAEEEPIVQKEENKEEVEDLSQPDVYYDQTVDDEIKDIIKKYYAKKLKKDTLLRIASIAVFALLVILVLYFALKYYNVF